MDYNNLFYEVMATTNYIALATIDPLPNVRLVDFIFLDNKIYFATFSAKVKTVELNQFSNVALATISIEQNGYVRIRNVQAIKSTKSAKELAPIFAIKDLNHFANDKDVVDNLIVYEIDLFNKDITVIKDACNIGTIRLDS